jgi:lysophospholipase L1-like esterase
MASSQNIDLVDLEKAMPVTMLGPDGTHPTAQGYTLMADTFFDAIKAALEVKPSMPQ